LDLVLPFCSLQRGNSIEQTTRLPVTQSNSAYERYELKITVKPDDIDQLGHVGNIIYLRWVQEAAVAHWRAAATPTQQAELLWVVMRHEIDYKRSAVLGDEIIARTWVGEAKVNLFERHTEILRASDKRQLALARTMWCPINAQTGKPTRVGQDVRERFSVPSD